MTKIRIPSAVWSTSISDICAKNAVLSLTPRAVSLMDDIFTKYPTPWRFEWCFDPEVQDHGEFDDRSSACVISANSVIVCEITIREDVNDSPNEFEQLGELICFLVNEHGRMVNEHSRNLETASNRPA